MRSEAGIPMEELVVMKVLYTAEAMVDGGRSGHGRTSDGRLEVDLSVPSETGGDGGPGTNPEQLFAVGYAACFQSALLGVARVGAWMRPTPRSKPGSGLAPRATAALA